MFQLYYESHPSAVCIMNDFCDQVALQSLNSHILFYTDLVVCERDMCVICNEKCLAKQPRLN